ncbi:MAG TPA: hypothetical protein VJ937_05640 [Salinivirga sp.]|uniref:hypothetical protein n=1 Tax=Salinivirga sp. TaxID=1970192 RepID=UPI002B4967CD|nr:hypothetical protein [Salinivirga sp.]HKK58938.1 hypothetical protein [Salinivirga sp.]
MKTVIYISGIIGGLAIVLSIIGLFMEFPFNNLLLIVGLLLVFAVSIPLGRFERYRYKKRIDHIKQQKHTGTESGKTDTETKSRAKGWDMNTSPFRKRKSGLTWGGGNVKGANASRGKRRSFLR